MSSSSVPSTVKRDARGCISVRTEVTTVGRDLFTARLRATLEALAQPDEPYVQRQALIDLAAVCQGLAATLPVRSGTRDRARSSPLGERAARARRYPGTLITTATSRTRKRFKVATATQLSCMTSDRRLPHADGGRRRGPGGGLSSWLSYA
jgi:hypothetical protein